MKIKRYHKEMKIKELERDSTIYYKNESQIRNNHTKIINMIKMTLGEVVDRLEESKSNHTWNIRKV